MAEFKHSLQLSLISFILLASIAAHVTSARDIHNHSHDKSSHIIFSQNLLGTRKSHNIEGIHDVKTYLKRYGYLTHIGSQPGAFDDDLESALKTYQKFFNLNVTGILDKETLSLMSQPRCGVPDIFQIFSTTRRSISTWEGFKDPVRKALILWSAYSHFGFTEAGRDELDDIKISFERGAHGDRHPFVPGTGVLAHAFAPTDGRFHLNVDQKWSVGAQEGYYDVQSVALHEIGHLLGLAHSKTKEAIMWPVIPTNFVKGLYYDDIAGLEALYGFPYFQH
ncbi:matrix metalloproteinase-9-like [Momordica charantia]|uniref:Matrix metalloproteinase-9-like n=1 Tax=Momordica charantia TaxID=3673 RepID=A0A6J1BZL4_MOMCH|nr:matrix metalloproteinase-9-like [Momordica charantia]